MPERQEAWESLYTAPMGSVVLQEAAALYERAAALNPNDERTWLQYGLLERRRSQIPSARFCFTKGIQAAPHNPYMYQV